VTNSARKRSRNNTHNKQARKRGSTVGQHLERKENARERGVPTRPPNINKRVGQHKSRRVHLDTAT